MRIILFGQPNTGKSSLFNRLTGLHQRVGNYPGITVERKEGRLDLPSTAATVVDLPGTYSLNPASLDESVAVDLISGHNHPRPDLLLCVADAANLPRTLLPAFQAAALGIPMVVAANFADEAEARGMHIDYHALSSSLGIPIVPTVGRTGRGLPELRRALAREHLLDRHRIEKQRRRDELVEDEDHHPEKEDEKLHRHLEQAVGEQPEPTFGHRAPREITLHLRLIGAEIRQRKKKPAQNPRPEVVTVVEVEGEVDGVEPPHRARHAGGVEQTDTVGQQVEHGEKGREHPDEDDQHLLELCPRHGAGAAGSGVDDHQRADRHVGQGQIPAQNHRQDERRSIDRQPGGEPALDQKKQRGEPAGFEVETFFEIFVGGVDLQAVEDRHRRHRQHDHRDRQPEIDLDKTHAVGERLAGGGKKSDRAGLCRHDRERDRRPAQVAIREQIALDVGRAATLDHAVDDDGRHRGDEHQPVDRAHPRLLPKGRGE
ncbi:MAG: hypothetical protein HC902_01715 [Calothrix sp. SM1_5_4]|nr:hypothetical protein [Calothrix sp. SM1_5_4]